MYASLVASALLVSSWHMVRMWTSSAAPTIKIRWSESTTPAERARLEQQFGLLNAEPITPHTVNYDLIDSRPDAIRAIVQHPAVADSGDIDAVRLTVSTSTEAGDTRRWIWHRWATYGAEVAVARILHVWLAFSVAIAATLRVRDVRRHADADRQQ